MTGAVTLEKVSVKASPLAQVWVMVMTWLATLLVGVQLVPLLFATTVLPVVGAVQPAGTVTVTLEPAGKIFPVGDVNVKTYVFVEPVLADAGLTVIAPSPLAAVT